MKTKQHSKSIRIRFLLPVMVTLLVTASSLFGQGFNQKYNIYLLGQITNNLNGAPLKNHEVIVVSDTANEQGFYYYNKLYTDNYGYYYDTVLTTLEKGALIISTTDHQDDIHDTIIHYRFTWTEATILIANLVLPAPPLINVYQANFTFNRNPSGTNKMEFQFSDLTSNVDIICWSWDFGDGQYSQEQNPLHTFNEPGLYKVELTVYISSGQNMEPVQSKIIKFLNVTATSYFHMGGHVFAGYFPIDKAEVYLYKIEDNNFIPIDTAMFNDSLGYYLFYQLIEGEYILKADLHPTSELFNMFIPTYYSDKMHWDDADTIFHYANNFEYDINLVPNNQAAAAGPGCIDGEISYDPTYGGGKSTPAENISIILYDGNHQIVDICHSDESGTFSLNQLDLDEYLVYAEVTGITTLPVEVILDENTGGNPSVHLVIDNQYVSGAVNAGTGDNWTNARIGMPFPNPATRFVSLVLDTGSGGTMTTTITNAAGQVMRSQTVMASGTVVLQEDVSTLPRGIYFIRLTDPANRSAVRKFIKD